MDQYEEEKPKNIFHKESREEHTQNHSITITTTSQQFRETSNNNREESKMFTSSYVKTDIKYEQNASSLVNT